MARKPKQVTSPIEYVTMRRISIAATGQTIEKYAPFPSGLEGVDYNDLINRRFIKTLDEFQKIDFGKCLSCGD